MGRKANSARLGTAAPKLRPDDLEEDAAVLTIANYEEDEIDDAEKEGGKRAMAWLLFKETGDKRLYLNKTMMAFLIEQYGDDIDAGWIGQPCAVERATMRFAGKSYEKVAVVADQRDWDDYLAEAGASPRRPAPPARRKKARKKASR